MLPVELTPETKPPKVSLRLKVKGLRAIVQYMENAPKVLRTHVYGSPAVQYGLCCPRNRKHKIEHSEFESHIWCYVCEKDYFIPQESYYAGIFSGIIMYEVSKILMGITYNRINIQTHEIIPDPMSFEKPSEEMKIAYSATWLKNKDLQEYEQQYRRLHEAFTAVAKEGN